MYTKDDDGYDPATYNGALAPLSPSSVCMVGRGAAVSRSYSSFVPLDLSPTFGRRAPNFREISRALARAQLFYKLSRKSDPGLQASRFCAM